METSRRGFILRDTTSGDGLISSQGEQFKFALESHWRSDKPPVTGAPVQLVFDEAGALHAVTLVDETQVAKERAEQVAGQALVYARGGLAHGRVALNAALRELGMPVLIGLGLLLLAWTSFNLVSVKITADQSFGLTLWNLLTIANSSSDPLTLIQYGRVGGSGAGLYGNLAIVALLCTLVPVIWKNKLANLGLAMPAVFIAVLVFQAYRAVYGAFQKLNSANGMLFGDKSKELTANVAQELFGKFLEILSLGLGFYVSIAISLYLAWLGFTRYRNTV